MRSENEDAFLVDARQRIFAVADGLGGLPEGSLASEIAVEGLREWLAGHPDNDTYDFADIFDRINTLVYQRGHEVSTDLGIGTTLTVAHVNGKTLTAGHIGDTALVIFKEDQWRQVTQDHTMAQEMIDRLHPGEEAFIPEYFSHTLTRCIGQTGKIKTDVYQEAVDPGDRILLFTDGVSKTMKMDELHERIFAATDPQVFVKEIIDTANDRGGPDNVTAVAIFIDEN